MSELIERACRPEWYKQFFAAVYLVKHSLFGILFRPTVKFMDLTAGPIG